MLIATLIWFAARQLSAPAGPRESNVAFSQITPALEAEGISAGDRILRVDGVEIRTAYGFLAASVRQFERGGSIEIETPQGHAIRRLPRESYLLPYVTLQIPNKEAPLYNKLTSDRDISIKGAFLTDAAALIVSLRDDKMPDAVNGVQALVSQNLAAWGDDAAVQWTNQTIDSCLASGDRASALGCVSASLWAAEYAKREALARAILRAGTARLSKIELPEPLEINMIRAPAYFYNSTGKSEDLDFAHAQLAEISQRYPRDPDLASAYRALRRHLEANGQPDAARLEVETAIKLDESSGAEDEQVVEDLTGGAYYDTKHLDYESFQRRMAEAAEMAERVRLRTINLRDRQYMNALLTNAYANEIAFRTAFQEPAQALEAMERAKSRSLADLIAIHRNAAMPSDEDAVLLDRLKDKVRLAYANLYQVSAEADTKTAREKAAAAEADLAAVQLVVDDRSPRLAIAEDDLDKPLNAAQIQSLLPAKSVLLDYYVGPRSLEIAAVSRDEIQVFRRPIAQEEFGSLCNRFRTEISAGSKWVADGQELFNKTIRPVEGFLRKSGAKRLLISPHGPLQTIPFACLVSRTETESRLKPQPSNSQSRSVPAGPRSADEEAKENLAAVCLRDEFAISWIPGSFLLKAPLKVPGPKDLNVLAVANPDFNIAVFPKLTALPGTVRELGAIQQALPSRIAALTGDEASSKRVAQLTKGINILHLACHGIEFSTPTDASGLVLAGRGTDDGVLSRLDIRRRYSLDGALVVMSACDTQLGADQGVEGIVGLPSAWFEVGAGGVISTLWEVDDSATSELMKALYAGIATGLRVDEALADAQLDLVRNHPDWSHPKFWAAFSFEGVQP